MSGGCGPSSAAAFFDEPVGGCIGPSRYDRSWSRGVLRATVPEIENGGIETLARRIGDPRDAAAMVTAARWSDKGCGIGLSVACAFVAWSLPAGATMDPRGKPLRERDASRR